MTGKIQCIYCQEDKPASAYKKAEHVIPQSFGRFENNFTLNATEHLVCDVCNQFFGDNLELALARDTLEGQSRVDFGIKKPENFKTPGHRSRIKIKIADEPFKGAYAYLAYSERDGKVTPQPVPQIGFQMESGDRKYFTLNEIPDKKQLEELGFSFQYPKAIRVVGLGVEEAKKKLAEKGIPFRYGGDVVSMRDSQSILTQVQATIDHTIFRATAKIAFNYLAYWEGGDFVRQLSFDWIRNFVRYGVQAPYLLVKVSQSPILADEGIRRRVGHLVTIAWAADRVSIVAQVSLLNLFKYSICLARNYEGERRRVVRGHFFNTYNGEILEIQTN